MCDKDAYEELTNVIRDIGAKLDSHIEDENETDAQIQDLRLQLKEQREEMKHYIDNGVVFREKMLNDINENRVLMLQNQIDIKNEMLHAINAFTEKIETRKVDREELEHCRDKTENMTTGMRISMQKDIKADIYRTLTYIGSTLIIGAGMTLALVWDNLNDLHALVKEILTK